MKTKLLQTNFTAGEVSPLMLGRVDTAKYANGLTQITNFIVRPQGPLYRRSGTRFVAEVKDSTKKTLLYEFEFSDVQSYILEIGNKYIRIYYNGGFVETAPNSGTPLEVVTPYLTADLAGLQFAQSADILYIVHPSYPPQQLERLGLNSWVLTPYINTDGPYLSDFNQDQSIGLVVSNIVTYAMFNASANVFGGGGSYKTATLSKGAAIGGSSTNFLINVACTAHGYSNGNTVVISGTTLTYASGVYPQYISNSVVNGVYVVSNVTTNAFTLSGSVYPWYSVDNSVTITIGGAPLVSNGTPYAATASFQAYREDNKWKLCKVTSVLDSFRATVQKLPFTKTYDASVLITGPGVGGGTVSASNSGVFTADDIGTYIRDKTGVWYYITAYLTSSTVTGTYCPLVIAAYTGNVITFTQEVNQATVTSTSALFATTDIGRHIRFNFGGKQPWAAIIGYTSTTVCTINLYQPVPYDPTSLGALFNDGQTTVWKWGAWSTTTGWPKCVTFHQQRLWFGGTTWEPENIWGSQSADYSNMSPTSLDPTGSYNTSDVADNCSLTYTLVANKANPIEWMESGPVILVGTQGGEWQIKAASSTVSAITPTNISVTPQTNSGSKSNSRTVRSGYAILFLQRASRKLMELTYQFQLDSYVGKDQTVVSEHVLRNGGGAVNLCIQQEPHNIVWIFLADGTLRGLTYDRDQEVAAWHSHIIGGVNAAVESVATCGASDSSQNVLYLIVKRTINGTTKRYIEYLLPDFYPTSAQDKAAMVYPDCNLQYIGSPATTFTAAHLLNETVTVVADGIDLGTKTLNGSGAITLTKPASNVIIGYNSSAIMGVLPLEGGAKDGGASQGKQKRVARVAVRLYASLGFSYGTDLNNLDECSFDLDGELMDASPDLFTGDKIVDMSMDYNPTGQYYIVQTRPYPLNILALAPDTEVTQ